MKPNTTEAIKKPGLLARIRGRLSNRSGQSTTEYILILAIVVMVASKMKKTILDTVSKSTSKIEGELDKWE